MILILVFSGFFLNNASVPVYLIWLRYISWFSYANEALVINQWDSIESIPCPDFNTTRCFQSGDEVIKYLDMKKDNFVLDISLLAGIAVFWRVVSFLVLLIKSRKK
jgi:hypothetical protein